MYKAVNESIGKICKNILQIFRHILFNIYLQEQTKK